MLPTELLRSSAFLLPLFNEPYMEILHFIKKPVAKPAIFIGLLVFISGNLALPIHYSLHLL
jgi:hypothetical protein